MGKPNLVIDRAQEKVFINGEIIGSVTGTFEINCMVKIKEEKINRLNDMTIIDFFDNDVDFVKLTFGKNFFLPFEHNLFGDIHVIFLKEYNYYIKLFLNLSFLWELPITIKSFFEKLNKSLNDYNLFEIDQEQLNSIDAVIQSGFTIDIPKDTQTIDIPTLFFEIKNRMKSSFHSTFLEIEQENNSYQPNLINTFTFPPEIQSSCEQYLIYFATFLKDIGINAETNIESKTHETLFTVIPENGEEALDNIKEALQVYLSLPESPEFENAVSEFQDIGAQQLASQVYFLKSQLMLANSAIQMKDATIKSLNMTNYQQSILLESHQTKKENEEVIANGLVKVNEVKVKGFTFDLPEILRRIKRKFT